jgi:hypothetical protein
MRLACEANSLLQMRGPNVRPIPDTRSNRSKGRQPYGQIDRHLDLSSSAGLALLEANEVNDIITWARKRCSRPAVTERPQQVGHCLYNDGGHRLVGHPELLAFDFTRLPEAGGAR